MKAISLNDVKKELSELAPSKLLELILRLAKHKKENKELLSYLLFDAENENKFIENQKSYMDEEFEVLNKKTIYLTKKGLRRILRNINKNIRFTGSKKTEIELLIYFSIKLKDSGIRLSESKVLSNLYQQQIIRINKAVALLHEELQSDYKQDIAQLNL
ncbi:MAG: hypothetical protein H0V01_08310 [Bacteroidetes bacterium]|nr:hypothetical protein [Bacteroidota bacterium]HET6243710.1 hypothetical protein [Bacteroidia bacterium]